MRASARVAAGIGADVPFFLTEGPQLGTGDGTDLEPLELPDDYRVVLVLPAGVKKPSTAAVYEAFDGADGFAERQAASVQAIAAGDLAGLPAERPRVLAARRGARELGAFRADVTGAARPCTGSSRGNRGGGRAARALGPRSNLAHGACLVRLSHA